MDHPDDTFHRGERLVQERGDPGSCLRPIRTCSSCERCPLQVPDYEGHNYFNTLGNPAVYLPAS